MGWGRFMTGKVSMEWHHGLFTNGSCDGAARGYRSKAYSLTGETNAKEAPMITSLETPLFTRRRLLLGGAVLAASRWLSRPTLAFAAEADGRASGASGAQAEAAGAAADSSAARPPGVPEGKPGDFKFLEGEWRIANRWRASAESPEWLTFEGEATCWSILGGVGSVEELRIPARNFSGMGLRLLDVERKLWSDFWVNAKSGVLTAPGTYGGFRDGVGTFVSQDVDGERPMQARGLWDGITGRSHRWSQAVSYDGGATWADTWRMEWKKV